MVFSRSCCCCRRTNLYRYPLLLQPCPLNLRFRARDFILCQVALKFSSGKERPDTPPKRLRFEIAHSVLLYLYILSSYVVMNIAPRWRESVERGLDDSTEVQRPWLHLVPRCGEFPSPCCHKRKTGLIDLLSLLAILYLISLSQYKRSQIVYSLILLPLIYILFIDIYWQDCHVAQTGMSSTGPHLLQPG